MTSYDRDLGRCLSAWLLAAASIAWGHDTGPEFIESFDTRLEISDAGALAVYHIIDVHPHGDEIRRGLFFELPEQVGPLHGFAAALNGEALAPEVDDGTIILAAEAPLQTHKTQRFELSYRAASPWWRTADGVARLRWAPVIAQFELAWREARILLDAGDAPARPIWPDIGAVDGRVWLLHFSGPLAGRRGAEVGAIEFGIPAELLPQQAVRFHGVNWTWRATLVAAMLGLLAFLHGAWRAVGRDPDLGAVSERARPPDGISPAASRFIENMGFDHVAFVAALVSLRVKDAISLEIDRGNKRLIAARQAADKGNAVLSPGEQAVIAALFRKSNRITLKPGSSAAQRAAIALNKTLGREHRGRHFVTNPRQRVLSVLGGLGLAGLGVAALIAELQHIQARDPVVIGLGVAAMVFALVVPMVYFELLKAPTRAGLTVRRQVAGLRKYLESRSRSSADAGHFVELLPYAVALGLEEPWRKRFADRLKDDQRVNVTEVIDWYERLREEFDSAGAIVPIIAASAGATAATGASSGASAGGV